MLPSSLSQQLSLIGLGSSGGSIQKNKCICPPTGTPPSDTCTWVLTVDPRFLNSFSLVFSMVLLLLEEGTCAEDRYQTFFCSASSLVYNYFTACQKYIIPWIDKQIGSVSSHVVVPVVTVVGPLLVQFQDRGWPCTALRAA